MVEEQLKSKTIFAASLFLGLAFNAYADSIVRSNSLVRLYRTENVSITDNLYTISADTRDASISCCGFAPRGTVAWVEGTLSRSGVPFYRFWKGAPQYEHFYTHDPNEVAIVTNNLGYTPEGAEGRIYASSPDARTVALHRLSKFNGATGDLQHYYTTSTTEVSNLTAYGGWHYDRIQGYVWPVPVPNIANSVRWHNCNAAWSGCAMSYITVPGIGGDGTGSSMSCPGTVDIFVDDQYVGHINWFHYGYFPGSVSSAKGCYQYWRPSLSNANYRLEFSGWSATVRSSLGGEWKVYRPPSTLAFTSPAR